MKRVIAILIVCILALSGCSSGFKDIRITSCNLVSITPMGLSSVEAKVEMGILNPTVQFTLSNVTGCLKLGDKPYILLTTGDITVAANSEAVYPLEVLGTLAEGTNPFVVLSILTSAKLDLSTFKADVKAHITLKNGVGKDIELKDLPLTDIVKKL